MHPATHNAYYFQKFTEYYSKLGNIFDLEDVETHEFEMISFTLLTETGMKPEAKTGTEKK